MLRILLGSCIVLLLVFGHTPDTAYACECPPLPAPKQAMRDSTVVFVGRVVEVVAPSRKLTFSRRPPFLSYEVAFYEPAITRFAVSRVYHGEATTTTEISSGRFAMACGWSFQENRNYLVYAIRTGAGDLMTHLCTRTRSLDRAADDLRIFNDGAAPQPDPPAVSWLWLMLAVLLIVPLLWRFAQRKHR
jgi:hypothetical protein